MITSKSLEYYSWLEDPYTQGHEPCKIVYANDVILMGALQHTISVWPLVGLEIEIE